MVAPVEAPSTDPTILDPRQVAVLIRDGPGAPYTDATWRITAVRPDQRHVHITFRDGETRSYRHVRVMTLYAPTLVPLTRRSRVVVDGRHLVTSEVLRFPHDDGAWLRVFTGNGRYTTVHEADVRIRGNAATHPGAAAIMDYLHTVVSRMEPGPIHEPFQHLGFVDRESALARFLHADRIDPREHPDLPIFPFGINTSQRTAVSRALENTVSVIDGPPGTGKTHAILSIIANLVRRPGVTVGVVSLSNPAVENVRDKLRDEELDFLVADLGHHEKRVAFFDTIGERRTRRAVALAGLVGTGPSDNDLTRLDQRLRKLEAIDRERAEIDHELAAYELEQRHFLNHLDADLPPEPAGLPLLRRSSRRVLALLAETAIYPVSEQRLARIAWWLRTYLRHGVARDLDPESTAVVLRLQHEFYERRIGELRRRSQRLNAALDRGKFKELRGRLRKQSAAALKASLAERFDVVPVAPVPEKRTLTPELLAEFPVVISTCHSLRRSLPDDVLLDYLIIDEASQVDLATAALGMALAKHIVVVGDEHQLAHIAEPSVTTDLDAPAPWADYQRKSILTATIDRHGSALPRTLLREHYRCDATIIEFCNRTFYDGRLIPFTTSRPQDRPLRVHRTAQGNHMRRPHGGGALNQREADAILQEVVPHHLVDIPLDGIAVVTPFRRQVETLETTLGAAVDKNTVHKYQGRQKQAVVMSAVLDETWRGRALLGFVDDPRLVNVAVSRAVERFVLVTNHDMMPRSRHLRDLIGYVEYRDPEAVTTSGIVSVFDLLYAEYSARLRPLSKRIGNRSRFRSENITWTVLDGILLKEPYRNLRIEFQVYLRNLLPSVAGLTAAQAEYVRRNASVDFVVHNRVTNRPLLAIEVDGWAFHANSPAQHARDTLKNEIFAGMGLELLRLSTVESGIEEKIQTALDRMLEAETPAAPGR